MAVGSPLGFGGEALGLGIPVQTPCVVLVVCVKTA
jgi:hypothetical protein